MIRLLEELSMNAWPSLQTVLDDGWILRFANGHTRRANSVHPLYPPHQDVEAKILNCERLYGEKKLNVIFKMTQASQPDGLDDILAARGYRAEWPTSVQLLHMMDWPHVPMQGVTLCESLTDEWFAATCTLGGIDGRRQATLWQMLANIVPATCFASIGYAGEVIACGLGVQQNGFVGLFDIVTDRRFRRQGYGEALVRAILAWGRQQGAHAAYLQVMLDNDPALRLYEKLGFREVYRYWYRIK